MAREHLSNGASKHLGWGVGFTWGEAKQMLQSQRGKARDLAAIEANLVARLPGAVRAAP